MSTYAPLQLAMYQQAVALLVASPTFYDAADKDLARVRPGSLMRLDKPANFAAEKQRESEVVDMPEATLLYGPATYPSFQANGRFGFGRGGPVPAGTAMSLTQGFALTITHRMVQAVPNDPLVMAAVDALQSAGPSMGLAPSVVPFALMGQIAVDKPAHGFVPKPVSGQPETTFRQQHVLRWDVTARWFGTPTPRKTTP